MLFEVPFLYESFLTKVAHEWSFASVRRHVILQNARLGASIVALVALVWFLSCMHPHVVALQVTSCEA